MSSKHLLSRGRSPLGEVQVRWLIFTSLDHAKESKLIAGQQRWSVLWATRNVFWSSIYQLRLWNWHGWTISDFSGFWYVICNTGVGFLRENNASRAVTVWPMAFQFRGQVLWGNISIQLNSARREHATWSQSSKWTLIHQTSFRSPSFPSSSFTRVLRTNGQNHQDSDVSFSILVASGTAVLFENSLLKNICNYRSQK